VKRSLWAVRAALAVGVLLLRTPTLTEPAWYSDDGFFMSVAWLNSQGLRLYSGVFDNSPPGIYWLYRLMLLLGARDHHIVVQAFAALAAAASSVLTFEVARRLAPGRPAILAGALTGFALSLPVLDGDLLNVELAGLPFFLAALAVAFRRTSLAAAASGVLLAVAILFRPSYALDGLAVLAALAMSGGALQRLPAALASGLAVAAAVLVALWLGGSLSGYFGTVLAAQHAYLLAANGGTLWPLALRLAVLGAAGCVALLRAQTPAGRVLAVWVPTAIAGASLTPRELTHYVHEAVPALAVGFALIAGRLRWRLAGSLAATAALVIAAEMVLIAPAQETALIAGRRPPPPFQHNFGYAGMAAYYGNWFAFVTGAEPASRYDAWFPGQAANDRTEIDRILASAGDHPVHVLVIGDRPWLYVKGGLLPATEFLATNSAFWNVQRGPAVVSRAIALGCADFVIEADSAASLTGPLGGPGYVRVTGTPWPTYRPAGRSSC
jgi:hypothetical protein